MMIEVMSIRKQISKIPILKGFLLPVEGELHYIGGNDVLPPPLESEEEGRYKIIFLFRHRFCSFFLSIFIPFNFCQSIVCIIFLIQSYPGLSFLLSVIHILKVKIFILDFHEFTYIFTFPCIQGLFIKQFSDSSVVSFRNIFKI